MKGFLHFEVPHLALWKSCLSEALATQPGEQESTAAAIDTDHPMMQATDRYCQAMQDNSPLVEPPADSDDEPAVLTWLSFLHHRRVHAAIDKNARLEAQLEAQTQEFKFGNPLWQRMYVQYFKYYWQHPYHEGRKPKYLSWQGPGLNEGRGDLQFGVISWRLPAKARVIIVGDIGTGTDVAQTVLKSALSFDPDAILHLGDVYFSGTSFETDHRLLGLINSVMEKEHRQLPVFMVPGNHEYFTGAVSFFDALEHNRFKAADNQRQRASFFCLRTADDGWQFLGLDTGFNGHYMNVAASAQQATLDRLHIGKVNNAGDKSDPHWPSDRNPYFRKAVGAHLPPRDTTVPVDQVTVRSDEVAWHQDKLAHFGGRSILLSHHQLYSALDVCGVAQRNTAVAGQPVVLDPTDFNRAWIDTGLWRQFGGAFGDKVAAWIWGHEHNLGIFEDDYRPADWPRDTPESTQIFKTLPKGRCAGHGAIPVQQSEAPYAQKYPLALKRPDLTLGLTQGWYNRGFEVVDFFGAGQAAKLRYFQVAELNADPQLIFEESIG